MTESVRDKWAQWLLEFRFGSDDPERRKAFLDPLIPVRDRVLANAALSEGDTLLDVGTGDGLIAFGALEKLGERGCVIFSDISQDLLDHSRKFAEEMGVSDRCEFVLASAEDLSALENASVDAVTTRSVLIYVQDKQSAFGEFYRVLKPGGRLSIFEPINHFTCPEPPHLFLGYDVTPLRDLADKVKAVFERIQPRDTDPMLNFDERDLFGFAENAGFGEIHLFYEAGISPGDRSKWSLDRDWEGFLKSSGNPKIPTIGEAMNESLTSEEIQRFTAHLRPLVENARRMVTDAVAYLQAIR